MKSTLQTFRDLPSYPRIVSILVGILHVFMGLPQFLLGLFLLTKSPEILQLWTAINIFNPNARTEAIVMAISVNLYLYGGLLVFFGFASLWVAIGNFMARPSIWLTTIWVTALYAADWVLGLAQITSVLQYILIILGIAAVIVYLFDKRIKAFFQRGPLSAQYAQWLSDKTYGRPVPPTPWEYQVKAAAPPITAGKPL